MNTLKMGAPVSPARTGVWVGIATITMSFAAYTSALMVRQGSGSDWQHFDLPRLLYFNTLLLLASSGTLELGRRRVLAGWRRGDGRAEMEDHSIGSPELIWLWVTLALGVLFLAGQVIAWRHLAAQGLFLATNPSSSFFYVLTILHALHLTGGIVALGWVLTRLRSPSWNVPVAALGAASLYWHFMGVLWLYLLLLLMLRL